MNPKGIISIAITHKILMVSNSYSATIKAIDTGLHYTQLFRIIHISDSGNVTLEDIFIEADLLEIHDGGGIFNRGVTTLNNCSVRGGIAESGGGIHNESGTLTLNDSLVSGNYAYGGCGGGLFNSGTVSIYNSTISENSADNYGGGISNQGSVTLVNCTLSDNTSNIYEIGQELGDLDLIHPPGTVYNRRFPSVTDGVPRML